MEAAAAKYPAKFKKLRHVRLAMLGSTFPLQYYANDQDPQAAESLAHDSPIFPRVSLI